MKNKAKFSKLPSLPAIKTVNKVENYAPQEEGCNEHQCTGPADTEEEESSFDKDLWFHSSFKDSRVLFDIWSLKIKVKNLKYIWIPFLIFKKIDNESKSTQIRKSNPERKDLTIQKTECR